MKTTNEAAGELASGLMAVFRGGSAGSSDGELLGRFVATGDEGAFAAIVERHGPMVMGVCRRILGGGADADDAFQATFLVLLRRARSLQGMAVLGPWLHGVAWRVGARARAGKDRRRAEEAKAARTEATGPAPESPEESAEIRAILDEELGRLPERYRAPVVLCCLEGMSREAAAERLRWRTGVLRGRLQRGRERLRDRLIRRGLAPALAAAAVEAIADSADAAVCRERLAATLAAVSRDLAVGEVARAVTPTAAATLAGAFLRRQVASRAAVGACVLAAASLAVAAFSSLVIAAGPRPETEPRAVTTQSQDAPAPKPRTFELKVVGPGNKPIPQASVEFRMTPPLGPESVRRGTFAGRMVYGPAVTTDAEGVLVVELPPGCQYLQLFVIKPGYGQFYTTWSSREPSTIIPEHFTADLEPVQSIGGIIEDADGKPVQGALVHCNVKFKIPPGVATPLFHRDETLTDREGRWRFEDIPRSMTEVGVEINHTSFQPLRRSLSCAEFGVAKGTPPAARITLDRGLTIAGKVTDEAGKPIAGAIVRTKFVNDRRETRTAEDGSYRLEGCEPRTARIEVLAKGHATDMKELRVDPRMGPVDFTLKPAVGLKIKVLDATGKPIPKARIHFQAWRGDYHYFEFDGINEYTDGNGEWSWDDAPLDELTADISPPSGIQLAHQTIPARDAAKVLTFRLPPQLVVSGQVLDAETKQPVKGFQVVPGRRWDASNQLSWSDHEGFGASDGRFEYRPSRPESVTLVRIEAEGYASIISRDIRRDEGIVALRFEMSRTRGLIGKVLTPKNHAAAGATLAVGVEGSQIDIKNGTIEEGTTDCKRATADALGRFSLPAQSGDFQLIILHPEGYAWIDSPPTWETVRLIRLEPWARVEGTVRIGPRSAPQVDLSLQVLIGRHFKGAEGRSRVRWTHEALSGPDGRFSIDRVLPGRGIIGRNITFMVSEGGTELTSSCKIGVDLIGGKMAKIDLGGMGRAMVGRLELPEGTGDKIAWNLARVDGTFLDPKNREGLPRLTATVSMDGHFRIDDVPPGRYRLIARFGPFDAATRQGLQGFSCSRTVDVPAPDREPENAAVDLGTMKLEKRQGRP